MSGRLGLEEGEGCLARGRDGLIGGLGFEMRTGGGWASRGRVWWSMGGAATPGALGVWRVLPLLDEMVRRSSSGLIDGGMAVRVCCW